AGRAVGGVGRHALGRRRRGVRRPAREHQARGSERRTRSRVRRGRRRAPRCDDRQPRPPDRLARGLRRLLRPARRGRDPRGRPAPAPRVRRKGVPRADVDGTVLRRPRERRESRPRTRARVGVRGRRGPGPRGRNLVPGDGVPARDRVADRLGAPGDASAEVPWRTRNVAHATFRGLELALDHDGPLGLRWNLSGTLLGFDSEAEDGFVSKYALRPLTRTVQLAVGRDWLGDALTLDAPLYRARRAGTDEPAMQDGVCTPGAAQTHTQADSRVAYRWRGVRLSLDVRNLTDAVV